MTQALRRNGARPAAAACLALLCWAASIGAAQAADHTGTLPVFQTDFGGVGLLQTPTARMAPLGDVAFNFAHVEPYSNYSFSLQPFSWMEAGFRYTSIGNRQYQASTENRDTLDKGVRLKLRLLDEGRYRPAVALGFRDLGGTGLFGSEYLVASKRWYNLDFSLGLGWGYLGSRGDLNNPLRVFGSRFKDRVGESAANGGQFNFKQFFTGPANLFGGIEYHTPFKPLTLQIEYDGHDYDKEPLNNPQPQDSPINVGARLRVGDNLTLSAAWERGNTAMLGATLSLNLATLSQPKTDPAPVVPKPAVAKADIDWVAVVARLDRNAGISASRISRKDGELIVEGASTRFRRTPEAELRANRILHNAVGPDIDTFNYRYMQRGMAMREDKLPRAPLPDKPLLMAPSEAFSDDDYRLGVTSHAASRRRIDRSTERTVYKPAVDRFHWSLGPDINQNYGGPDGYLYQILARVSAEYKTDAHGWFSGKLAYTLLDNLDNYNYIADSQLPRVRTYIGNYLRDTDLGVYNLQYTRTARLSDNWFGMAYAGYLEMMYAGVGGEVMFRDFNSPVAYGFDANYVKQRDFDTRFGLRDYETWVGNASVYYQTGIKDILAKASIGRYLAGDFGTTLDFSRRFDSGVRVGAYATFTDAGNDYGEGSFDKGIYISMPLDVFFTKSSRGYANLAWRPLTRDGGAKLYRRYTLYGITQERELDHYWTNFVDERQ